MAFRFWRRVRIAPGVTLNLSRAGGSVSLGPRGAKLTIGRHGGRVTAGIPGTGIFYSERLGGGRGGRSKLARSPAPAANPAAPLTLGFFERLVTPPDEQAFVAGCRALATGDDAAALEHLRQAVDRADGAFLAGFLALGAGRLAEAATDLVAASTEAAELGRLFAKHGIACTLSVPITDVVTAHVEPGLHGVYLGLVEVYQAEERWEDARTFADRLHELAPDDLVVRASLAELLLAEDGSGQDACRRVVELSRGVENTTPIATALLLYKARALHGLGLDRAARDTLSAALRRKKGRSDELLAALRYERAGAYEALGNGRRARADLEALYAADPGYEDVAEKLGLEVSTEGSSAP